MEDETVVVKLPNLELADLRFYLSIPRYPNKAQVQERLLEAIRKDAMSGFYKYLVAEHYLPLDQDLLASIEQINEEKIKAFDNAIVDAENNLGESEVREALLSKANYFCLIGAKEQAIAAYASTAEKTVALGQRLDITFTLVRLGFFFDDYDLVNRSIRKAHSLMEEGSDWDRRNRLKTYEAIQAMHSRKFDLAANLLIETLATFTSYEVFTLETFIFYTVIAATVSLDRISLKKKIIDSPEVLAVIQKTPHLSSLLNDYYNGEYRNFLIALLGIFELMNHDRLLSQHSRWYFKEMRIKVYAQFLENYQSVQLDSMASQFGLSPKFLDEELSRFISVNRINCKIDKVGGIIQTNRSDNKNVQYETLLKQGDMLLNRIQKLAARVVNM
ncbi:26S proteasome non-ATPase regulatory subunit 6-like [Schistocerca gregaria]|uniref:26S proteasome non-ATPase regulatory subunit 6-like n=1 Tax=Schistocerca gregaria TaxID=7010 RepID=UPI00211E1197|nr:26S proteasome non-ATPase regulatory subunit 6-like [Schistocerca gregaria]